ncbi:MAG: dipeptidase PepE [Bacteroidetes bacterium]|nr:MAG: dipeptidase PepE [Bacteroidota bacterium]
MLNLLLLSNSTNKGEEYMQWCNSIIASFVLEHKQNIVFIPYAAVGFTYELYTNKVNETLVSEGIEVKNIASFENRHKAIEEASAIFVGGGNTFHLLKTLEDENLVELIRKKVNSGIPYVGWSAGSNIASPTICTTNDMPIVEPKSFKALDLVKFQINPHYTEETLPNHGGESRLQRLQEYIAANKEERIVCLPEATYLVVEDDLITFSGNKTGKILGSKIEEIITDGQSLIG